jgi:hypothetical protein
MIKKTKTYKKMVELLAKKKKKDKGIPKNRGKDSATQTSKVDMMRDAKRGRLDGMRGDKVRSRHATPRTLVGESLPFSERTLNKIRAKMGKRPTTKMSRSDFEKLPGVMK